MSEPGNGNGNGQNGWMRTVLLAMATLILGGGVGSAVTREPDTRQELTALRHEVTVTKERLIVLEVLVGEMSKKLDTALPLMQKEGRK